jgi:hypothetical protein
MTQKDRMSVFQEFRAASSGTYLISLYPFYSIWAYLLLGALSPVLPVEVSRTRQGIIVCHHYSLLRPSTVPPIIFHICSIAISRHYLVTVHCSLHCLSLVFFIACRHYILFVTACRRRYVQWLVLQVVYGSLEWPCLLPLLEFYRTVLCETVYQ